LSRSATAAASQFKFAYYLFRAFCLFSERNRFGNCGFAVKPSLQRDSSILDADIDVSHLVFDI
jgi:hypothetical protein